MASLRFSRQAEQEDALQKVRCQAQRSGVQRGRDVQGMCEGIKELRAGKLCEMNSTILGYMKITATKSISN